MQFNIVVGLIRMLPPHALWFSKKGGNSQDKGRGFKITNVDFYFYKMYKCVLSGENSWIGIESRVTSSLRRT